jgi:DNA-binding FadR family transcriptional regulator
LRSSGPSTGAAKYRCVPPLGERAAILTKKFGPGDQLPSGNDMARTYDVSRATVQDALRVLKNEGLLVSVQGRGVYVRERTTRPVALRPHIERAFEQAKVSIDFAGSLARLCMVQFRNR